MGTEIRLYNDARKEKIDTGSLRAKALDADHTKDLFDYAFHVIMRMIRQAAEKAGSIDGWVFICHPSSWLAGVEEFAGHEVCVDSECPPDKIYFAKDFRRNDDEMQI